MIALLLLFGGGGIAPWLVGKLLKLVVVTALIAVAALFLLTHGLLMPTPGVSGIHPHALERSARHALGVFHHHHGGAGPLGR